MGRDVSPIAVYAGFCVLVVLVTGGVLGVLHVLKVARKVRTLISDPFDVDPVDAQLDSNPREDDLIREIDEAIAQYRHGVDVFEGAPKEMAP